jgi:hypothetical protein
MIDKKPNNINGNSILIGASCISWIYDLNEFVGLIKAKKIKRNE